MSTTVADCVGHVLGFAGRYFALSDGFSKQIDGVKDTIRSEPTPSEVVCRAVVSYEISI